MKSNYTELKNNNEVFLQDLITTRVNLQGGSGSRYWLFTRSIVDGIDPNDKNRYTTSVVCLKTLWHDNGKQEPSPDIISYGVIAEQVKEPKQTGNRGRNTQQVQDFVKAFVVFAFVNGQKTGNGDVNIRIPTEFTHNGYYNDTFAPDHDHDIYFPAGFKNVKYQVTTPPSVTLPNGRTIELSSRVAAALYMPRNTKDTRIILPPLDSQQRQAIDRYLGELPYDFTQVGLNSSNRVPGGTILYGNLLIAGLISSALVSSVLTAKKQSPERKQFLPNIFDTRGLKGGYKVSYIIE